MSLAQSLRPIPIDQNIIAAAAKNVAAEIQTRCMPKRVILFGSAANGSFKFGSDLDFILIFGDASDLRAARANLAQNWKITQRNPD